MHTMGAMYSYDPNGKSPRLVVRTDFLTWLDGKGFAGRVMIKYYSRLTCWVERQWNSNHCGRNRRQSQTQAVGQGEDMGNSHHLRLSQDYLLAIGILYNMN